MKTIKRSIALVLAMILTLAMSVTVFAAPNADQNTFSLTLNKAVKGHTYEAYQILSGDLSADKTTLSQAEPDNTVSEVANVNSEEEELVQKLQSLQTQIDEAQQTLQDLQSSVDIEKTLLDNITAETNQHYKTLQGLENHLGALGFRDISQLQKLLVKLDSKEFQMNKDLLIEKPSVCLLNKIIKTKLPQYVFNEESCKNFKLKNGIHAGKKLSVVYSTEYSYFEHIFKLNLITVLVMLNLMYTYKTDLSRLSFSPVDNNR